MDFYVAFSSPAVKQLAVEVPGAQRIILKEHLPTSVQYEKF